MSSFARSPFVWGLVIVVACCAGAGYWAFDNHQQRKHFAQELVESDRLEQLRLATVEAKRKLDQQKLLAEIQAQRDADDQKRQLLIERSQAELTRKRFVADEPALPLDERVRREREVKAQNEAASEMVRAQNEVIRQKNYVLQREHERALERHQRDSEAAERARQGSPQN
ncbi:MAG: hypothetical protein ABI583_11165 [Betaproteobacteria bacterium]